MFSQLTPDQRCELYERAMRGTEPQNDTLLSAIQQQTSILRQILFKLEKLLNQKSSLPVEDV